MKPCVKISMKSIAENYIGENDSLCKKCTLICAAEAK